jgi:hypothetical protein
MLKTMYLAFATFVVCNSETHLSFNSVNENKRFRLPFLISTRIFVALQQIKSAVTMGMQISRKLGCYTMRAKRK